MPIQIDVWPLQFSGPCTKCLHARLVAWYQPFVSLREDMVDAHQEVRPVEQGLEQVDLGTFDVDLQYSDIVTAHPVFASV